MSVLTYSGISNYGKASLPSVDTWGTDMNILRDPPKSITTRRIDKVGQTSSITEMVDESENRAAECILQYARGVNPSVSVSYSNVSNNGGQLSSGMNMGLNYNSYGKNSNPASRNGNSSAEPFNQSNGGNFNYRTNSVLPYHLSDSFRPPVLTGWDLMPLSRLPRVWTSSFTQPGFADFSKKMKTCGTAEQTKEVKNNLLKTSARPTAVYKIETPLEKPFEVKYTIQPLLKKSYTTPIRSTDRTEQFVSQPNKEINNNSLHAFANSNISDVRYVDNNDFNTEKYIQDINNASAFTNIKSNYTQIGSMEDIMDTSNIRTKENLSGSYGTNFRGNDKVTYLHEDLELGRNMPNHNATTNIKHNQERMIQHEYQKELERNRPSTEAFVNSGQRGFSKDNNITQRSYKLIPKVQAGGYEVPVQMPTYGRNQQIKEPFESEKSRMNRLVMESQIGRYAR